MIKVEICYASPEEQYLLPISIPSGSTVIRAIMTSGILDRFPNLEINNNVGIFSKKVPLNQILNDGDRVEIYRPLILTPNQLRLLRGRKSSS